ncbi:hypothetical protein HBH49_001660 [Parastagonospora nodorum]|nr:hypothetical protein HBH49_001660 [Parastagonospora nodorum]KAH6436308.1 hypothetical protein HBI14_009240 [Parastagonospora nodorum]KAH6446470.1 hypothetical protein HBI57_221010 [Parastagonospora nodorum]KAH6480362.1 hypothetical protein HBI58_077500 [Parastagonospora nodorum]
MLFTPNMPAMDTFWVDPGAHRWARIFASGASLEKSLTVASEMPIDFAYSQRVACYHRNVPSRCKVQGARSHSAQNVIFKGGNETVINVSSTVWIAKTTLHSLHPLTLLT